MYNYAEWHNALPMCLIFLCHYNNIRILTTDSECKTSTSAPRKYPTDLQQHIGRLCKWVDSSVRCCLDVRFLQLQCWTGWDAWSTLPFPNLQPHAASGNHRLPIVGEDRKVSVFVHADDRRFRSAWDDFTAWRYDMQETASTKSNPCPAWNPGKPQVSTLACARACQGVCEPHSALRLRSPTNIGHSATHREYVEIVLHASPRSCVSQHRHMPKRLAAPNPNNEARKHASSIAGVRRVRWVRRVRLGPSIQGCMARSMGFNTAVATWHSSCFRPALTHLSYCKAL